MKIDLQKVEEASKEIYIRALKLLPPDIKQGFDRLGKNETNATGKAVLENNVWLVSQETFCTLAALSGAGTIPGC